jgi:hypothetical protein
MSGMVEDSEPPDRLDADRPLLLSAEGLVPGADESVDPYARESAIEQLKGPGGGDDCGFCRVLPNTVHGHSR